MRRVYRSETRRVLRAVVYGLAGSGCALPDSAPGTSVTTDVVASSTGEPTDGSDGETSSVSATATEGESGTAVVPMCGNGDVEGDEECDDGNFENDDACLMDCTAAYCGDGFLRAGVEDCDDGNAFDHDGCPTTCEFAYCGDGFVQAEVEECDDANTNNDDGCSQDCIRTRTVFVTSAKYQANFGGLLGADQVCQALATIAELERPTQYKAWLSDNVLSPDTRFHHSSGRYELVSGEKIADSWEDLVDGTIDHPIDRDEYGEPVNPVSIFTNTRTDGTTYDKMYNCSGWTTGEFEYKTWVGHCGYSTQEWTDSDFYSPALCGATIRLYCFEQ